MDAQGTIELRSAVHDTNQSVDVCLWIWSNRVMHRFMALSISKIGYSFHKKCMFRLTQD